LPLQIELTMAVGAKGEESRQIFWIPPKQNIEVAIRQMMQSGGNNAATGGNGNGNGGQGGGGIQIGGGGLGGNGSGGQTPQINVPPK
jgi:hypothetical protein